MYKILWVNSNTFIYRIGNLLLLYIYQGSIYNQAMHRVGCKKITMNDKIMSELDN